LSPPTSSRGLSDSDVSEFDVDDSIGVHVLPGKFFYFLSVFVLIIGRYKYIKRFLAYLIDLCIISIKISVYKTCVLALTISKWAVDFHMCPRNW
jgi:hypothetical protein